MSMFRCTECGNPVSDAAFTCPNCGRPLREQPFAKPNIPGKGLGIAGMVLGIIGAFYSVICTFAYIMEISTRNEVEKFLSGLSNTDGKEGILMGITFMVFGILSLVFGILSYGKGYRNGVSISAIVLGSINIIFCLVLMGIGISLLA